jgi:hypothetical protein
MAMARGPHVLLGEELHVADLKAHRPYERGTAFFDFLADMADAVREPGSPVPKTALPSSHYYPKLLYCATINPSITCSPAAAPA